MPEITSEDLKTFAVGDRIIGWRPGAPNDLGNFSISSASVATFLGAASETAARNALSLGPADSPTFAGVTVTDEAYSEAGWNGDNSVPTKNAVRDKIEMLSAGSWSGLTGSPSDNGNIDATGELLMAAASAAAARSTLALDAGDSPTFAGVSVAAGGQLSVADSATQPPLNIVERATAPSTPATNDIYLDDGSNTGSGLPGWRRYTGAVWEDVSASAGGGGGDTWASLTGSPSASSDVGAIGEALMAAATAASARSTIALSAADSPTFTGISISGGQLSVADSATQPPLNIVERATAPSSPSAGDIYLDDGSNTASTAPGFRRYDGASWEDVGATSAGAGSNTWANLTGSPSANSNVGATGEALIAAATTSAARSTLGLNRRSITNGGVEDDVAWSNVIGSRVAIGSRIAGVAAFTAYPGTPANFDDPDTTTIGAVEWADDVTGTNHWRGGSAGFIYMKDPSGANNGKAKRFTISGLTEGKKYSVWCGLLIDDTGFGTLIGRLGRGPGDVWYQYGGDEDSPYEIDPRVYPVEDGQIVDVAHKGRMVFVDNMVANQGGQISYVIEDLSGAGSDRTYFAGTGVGEPMPDPDQSDWQEISQLGVWSWFGDPRAIILADGTYLVGSVNAGGSSAAIHFDPTDGSQTEVELSSWEEKDDHNFPAFVETSDSKVLSAYSKHAAENLNYFRKSSVATPTVSGDWGAETSKATSNKATYAYLFKVSGGTLYWFYRNKSTDWSFRTSTDDGATWSSATPFMDHSTTTFPPYLRMHLDANDVFQCIAAESPNIAASPVWHFAFDGTNILNSDGTTAKAISAGKLVVDTELNASSTVFTPTGDQLPWVSQVVADGSGNPRALFTTFEVNDTVTLTRADTDKVTLYYAAWDSAESAWNVQAVANLGNGIHPGNSLYAGEATIDPNYPGRIVIATNAFMPFDLDAPHSISPRGVHELWQGMQSGDNNGFEWSRISMGSEPGKSHFRPFIGTNAAGTKSVLFWLHGIYSDDDSYPYGGTAFRIMSKPLPL